MGRAADPLERTRGPLEPESRPARRQDSEFSRPRFDETGSGAQLSLRNVAARNRTTRDLPFRADRDGIEHDPVAIAVALYLAGKVLRLVREGDHPVDWGEGMGPGDPAKGLASRRSANRTHQLLSCRHSEAAIGPALFSGPVANARLVGPWDICRTRTPHVR